MVRLNGAQGRALRSLTKGAGAQPMPQDGSLPLVGKPVYLPQFTIALIRTPEKSSKYAQFQVPLNFNKFDLRSYLWNLYGVGVNGIRSFVQAQPITRVTRDGKGFGPWRRPKSQKRMTVELKEPFSWPEEPKDLSPWEYESWKKAEVWQKEQQDKENPKRNAGEEPDRELRAAYKEQAKALLEKRETWRPTWKALGLDPSRADKTVDKYRPSSLPNWYSRKRSGSMRK